MKMLSRGSIVGKVILVIVIGLVVYGVWWINQSYQPEPEALEVAKSRVDMRETANGYVLSPKSKPNGVGIIFVTGGKVEPLSYAYKLSAIVSRGYTVILTNPVFNLAPLDIRTVPSFTGEVGSVDVWIAAGHSVGGIKACEYANESSQISGAILLGSYCSKPLDKPILVISGSRDPLTTSQDIEDNSQNMPRATYKVIDGSTHAQFGNYGVQKGDANQTIRDGEVYDYLLRYETDWLNASTKD